MRRCLLPQGQFSKFGSGNKKVRYRIKICASNKYRLGQQIFLVGNLFALEFFVNLLKFDCNKKGPSKS